MCQEGHVANGESLPKSYAMLMPPFFGCKSSQNCLAEWPAQKKGRQSGGVHFLTLHLSCFPLPGFPLPAPVTPWGFLWWQSSSLCEANDLPLCEAYWRLDLDTDSADGLSAPLLASPETGAGPVQSAAPVHSHGGGPGPTEHT